MSAIQPNLNFDNQKQEHTPYGQKYVKDMKAAYDRIQQEEESIRCRARAVKDPSSYNKWFNPK